MTSAFVQKYRTRKFTSKTGYLRIFCSKVRDEIMNPERNRSNPDEHKKEKASWKSIQNRAKYKRVGDELSNKIKMGLIPFWRMQNKQAIKAYKNRKKVKTKYVRKNYLIKFYQIKWSRIKMS